MKYIEQYIKKLCPEVKISKSKTTDSVYYTLGHNFIVRLSNHYGNNHKENISVVKSFNTDDFIVTFNNSRFPLIKTRKEVKELIRVHYELCAVTDLTNEAQRVKRKATVEGLADWGSFWSYVCQNIPIAVYLSKQQKSVIKKYFERGFVGENMCHLIKKIKPITEISTIKNMFEKELERE